MTEASYLNKDKLCVKLDSMESKKELVSLNRAAKPQDGYIQNDLTVAQQEAGFIFRSFVRSEKALGHTVEVSRQVATINGINYRYDYAKKSVEI